jgi:hypothetical protein
VIKLIALSRLNFKEMGVIIVIELIGDRGNKITILDSENEFTPDVLERIANIMVDIMIMNQIEKEKAALEGLYFPKSICSIDQEK